jgi:signal transduction histidine kinase
MHHAKRNAHKMRRVGNFIVYDGNCPALQRKRCAACANARQRLWPSYGRSCPQFSWIRVAFMQFDDRLATVLRSPVGGDRAARTQYRQLLDLLGNAPGTLTAERYAQLAAQSERLSTAERERIIAGPANPALLTFLGWQRLEHLAARIPAAERALILREPGQRLRNPQLIGFLARSDDRAAAAALSGAQLSQAQWADLIPRLPVMARGFLRQRRDLPAATRTLLGNLGVGDMGLPPPADAATTVIEGTATPATPAPFPQADRTGIRALLQRIEEFREGRRPPASGAPRLPLGDLADDHADHPLGSFDFTTDAENRINWASGDVAPLVVGMRLGRAGPGTLATLADPDADALRQHQLLRGAALMIAAAPVISGEWRIDAEPRFDPSGGSFAGYRGRLRRPLFSALADGGPPDSPHDRMRQVLHELRTPVNAIQGFAEVIQQQIFGPAPNAYRALAAGVAVDAAKLLAAFEEIDRLARLESRALDLGEGEADLREAVVDTIRRLDGVLRPRDAAMELQVTGSPFTTPLARDELLGLVWRVLATLAGAMAPAERISVRLDGDDTRISLQCDLPAAITAQADPFATTLTDRQPALSSGMFGSGFALRLARAEVQSCGGSFEIDTVKLTFTLPPLTGQSAPHSKSDLGGSAA